MKLSLLSFFLVLPFLKSFSQSINDSISKNYIEKIINYLASDSLKGRVNHTEEQKEAAAFIYQEFANFGLKPFPGLNDYYHAFRAVPKDENSTLYNLIGVIPGKSRADECIIFSAHFDHVNSETAFHPVSGKIFNGANDNASGTAAVLLLAKYFAQRANNERTLIFCLFAGEELGLLGSRAFSTLVNLDSIKAVINVEMIGRTNRTGKRAFFITGSDKSDLITIMKKNLKGEKMKVYDDEGDITKLYERSDNFPFALKGIPAHSIMCSDDKELCYHKPCDDAKRIDFENMAKVIQAIAKGCSSLISGVDTPVRIK